MNLCEHIQQSDPPVIRFRSCAAFRRHLDRGMFSEAAVYDKDATAFLFVNGVVRRVEWPHPVEDQPEDVDLTEVGRS